jgi:hypothetical protein
MTRLYGYAPRGQRAYGKAPENTDPNLTLVFGLGMEGVVAPVVFEGAIARRQLHSPISDNYISPSTSLPAPCS